MGRTSGKSELEANVSPDDGGASLPEIVINEIIQNPSAVGDRNSEWFEIHNAGASTVDIDGWTIRDAGSDSHVINNGGPLEIAAGGYLVLGNNDDPGTNGGVVVNYDYGSSFSLANSDDELILENTMLKEIDRVEWDGGPTFPDPTGASMALVSPTLDNNNGGNWITSMSAFGDGDFATPGAQNDMPVTEVTLIHDIQGSTDTSPMAGVGVLIEGVVVGDFQDTVGTNGDLDGFYVQEETTDWDADPVTSEGIFVFEGSSPAVDVAVGDLVRVSGTVDEYFGETQIKNASVEVASSGLDPDPVALSLLFATAIPNFDGELIADLEAYEGMLVEFPEELFVTELFNLDRFGEMRLAAKGRQFQFTNSNAPDETGFAAHLEAIALDTVMLDDGFSLQNPTPIPYPAPGLDDANTVRVGDGVTGLVGVVRYARGSAGFGDETYRIQPAAPVSFTVNAPRPTAPAVVGSLRVASFNVLNFFNDLGDGSGACFPSFTTSDCRGADSAHEFERQKTKLVQAISALDADIIGLVEIENDYPDGTRSAIAELTAAINDADIARCPQYAWVDPQGRVGGDAIAVGFLYCRSSVRVVQGSVGVLTDSALTGLGLDHLAPVFDGVSTNRAPLAAAFRQRITRSGVTIVVNHFKSKGDSGLDATCDPDPSVDPNCDQGDGQGYWNAMRTNGATALGAWLNSRGGRRDTLIVGDLNAYRQEDPIQSLIRAGYVDVVTEHADGEPYSFVFDGQAGLLDHALATPDIARRINSVDVWHSNADEPDGLDYNLDFRRPPDAFDGATPYRASDHDPVLIGLSLPTID